ncbi:MAG: DNA repair protein RadC, partial [Anaerolineales bacterium]
VRERGIGRAKASAIKAAIELGRRLSLEAPEERPSIGSPRDAADLVMFEMQALEKEHLRVILLDTRNHVIEIYEVYRGSLNASVVRIPEVFTQAVRRNAASLVVVHNHPSGDPAPSPEDINITRALVQAGKLLEIEVLDHIIIGQGQYTSLKERGLGFSN